MKSSPRTPKTIDLEFYIPVKDGEPFIAECLEAIFNQTLQPKRIVVYVNMNSTDRTLEIVKRYPVEVREVFVPLSDARNLAIRELKSEWIGCCDADVILDSRWIEELWARRSTGAVMITGNTQERIRSIGDLFRSITSPHNWGDVDVDNPYMVVPDQIAQREKLVAVGGYKTGLLNYEDAEICTRLRERGHRFYYVASAKAEHWRSDNFLTSMALRHRHSLQRQIQLLSTEEGLTKKFKNNIALALPTLSKAREIKNDRLLELALLLPLQHFSADVEEALKLNASLTATNTVRSESSKEVFDVISTFRSLEWSQVWNRAVQFSNLNIYQSFLQLYFQFLRSALNPSPTTEIFALSDSNWMTTLSRAVTRAKDITGIEFDKLPPIDARSLSTNTQLPPSGALFFRQPLFPTLETFWTCRDLTQFVARQQRRLVWTETFQGSTVICFETIANAEQQQRTAARQNSQPCVLSEFTRK